MRILNYFVWNCLSKFIIQFYFRFSLFSEINDVINWYESYYMTHWLVWLLVWASKADVAFFSFFNLSISVCFSSLLFRFDTIIREYIFPTFIKAESWHNLKETSLESYLIHFLLLSVLLPTIRRLLCSLTSQYLLK